MFLKLLTEVRAKRNQSEEEEEEGGDEEEEAPGRGCICFRMLLPE